MFLVFAVLLVLLRAESLTRRRTFILQRYFEVALEKAVASSRKTERVVNHTVLNHMADGAGEIELFLNQVDSEDPIYSELHSATICLQRGMRACQHRRAYTQIASNEYKVVLQPVRLAEFVGELVAGSRMQVQGLLSDVGLSCFGRERWFGTQNDGQPKAVGGLADDRWLLVHRRWLGLDQQQLTGIGQESPAPPPPPCGGWGLTDSSWRFSKGPNELAWWWHRSLRGHKVGDANLFGTRGLHCRGGPVRLGATSRTPYGSRPLGKSMEHSGTAGHYRAPLSKKDKDVSAHFGGWLVVHAGQEAPILRLLGTHGSAAGISGYTLHYDLAAASAAAASRRANS